MSAATLLILGPASDSCSESVLIAYEPERTVHLSPKQPCLCACGFSALLFLKQVFLFLPLGFMLPCAKAFLFESNFRDFMSLRIGWKMFLRHPVFLV